MTDLTARAQTPMTRHEFAAFLEEFAESLATDPTSWTNETLGTFLDGLAGWIADMDGYFENRGEPVPREPSWQFLAQALLAGRIYE